MAKELQPMVDEFIISTEVPDYIDTNSSRGNENVSTEDRIVPRLKVCAAQSYVHSKSHPTYIDGIQDGDFYNTITLQNYGPEVKLVFIGFKTVYNVWKTGQLKDGYRGSFLSMAEAESGRIQTALKENGSPEGYTISMSHQHLALILDGKTVEPILFDMSATRLQVSKTINAMISQFGGDRFSRVYMLSSVEVSNSKGRFHTIKVSMLGFTPKPVFEKALMHYNRKDSQIASSDVSEYEESSDF